MIRSVIVTLTQHRTEFSFNQIRVHFLVRGAFTYRLGNRCLSERSDLFDLRGDDAANRFVNFFCIDERAHADYLLLHR